MVGSAAVEREREESRMSVRSRLAQTYNQVAEYYATPYRNSSLVSWTERDAPHADLLDTLLGYYFSNGLYQELNLVVSGAENTELYQKVKAIRNPTSAFVSFYGYKLFPTPLIPVALPQTAPSVLERIAEIWRRSAWMRMRKRASFHFSLFGELFIRAGQRESDRLPILQLVDPRHVVEMDRDDRGFIEWIRIETPVDRRDAQTGKVSAILRVEIFQKGRRRVWELDRRVYLQNGVPSANPLVDDKFEDGSLPIDFVPIAYAPFISVDNSRGISPILTALEDIDEANRIATRLHAMLFRGGRSMWVASANANDPAGRPMPAPQLADAMTTTRNIELEDGDSILGLPGMSTLTSLVPALPYGEALSILQSHVDHIAETKLFELGYYRTTTGTEESGRARRYRLAPALNRAEEARTDVLDALMRAHMMLFTIAQNDAIPGYSKTEIGTFDGDGYNHAFQEQDMLIVSTDEQAETIDTLVRAGSTLDGAARFAGATTAEKEMLVNGDPVDRMEQ
jgi:hypothetical protein